MAPTSTHHLGSVAFDRYFRLHTTAEAPQQPNGNFSQLKKPETVVKTFVKSTPTVVVWDAEHYSSGQTTSVEDDEDEDVWNGMGAVELDSSDDQSDHDEVSSPSKKRLRT